MSPREGAVSITDKHGAVAPCVVALVLRPCGPEWARLCFEAVLAGRQPINRAWQADVGARMRALRAGLGLR